MQLSKELGCFIRDIQSFHFIIFDGTILHYSTCYSMPMQEFKILNTNFTPEGIITFNLYLVYVKACLIKNYYVLS